MTAVHPRRTGLEVVPHAAQRTTGTDATIDGDDWRAQTVIDQYSAEHQLVGSLMWLSANAARSLLNVVPDSAIWRPQTRWAYELIRRVVDDGGTPTPPAVLAAGREHAASDALDPAHTPAPLQHRQLALYLFDAYSQAVAPAAAATTYAREVLDEAYRRTYEACGLRMQQLAAAGADCDDLSTEFAAIHDELAELWRRGHATVAPDANQQRDHPRAASS